jgi:chromosomal replication initiator protein
LQQKSNDLTAIWEGVREELRTKVPPSAFESWLEPLSAVGVQGTRLYVDGPDRVRDWFERRYRPLAVAAVRERVPAITEIVFAEPATEAGSFEAAGSRSPSQVPAGLARDLDFDRFVIGDGNRFAHAAALAVAEAPGEAYNPLFIYGDPGLGKTHLLVSIANYLQRRRPDMTVVYTTAERFTSEFVGSLRGGGTPGRFKARYRNVGALLIDDVQFLEGKLKTEDEFFHTFNELYAAGSQIVLSSDRPPEAIERLTDRLRDRFAWGLTVQVKQPDLATRIVLLRRLAAERAINVTDTDVLRQIAQAVPANLRRLEGALTRVAAFSSLLGEAPSAELVEQALASPDSSAGTAAGLPAEPSRPSIAQVQDATCDVLRVSRADLNSPRRAANLVRARQIAIYVARDKTGATLAEIARAFERDHSTVLHSIRSIEKRLEPGSDIHRAIEAVHGRLQTRPATA